MDPIMACKGLQVTVLTIDFLPCIVSLVSSDDKKAKLTEESLR